MAGTELLEWSGDRLVPAVGGDDPLLAADSWLVEHGRARGLALHAERFTRACAGTVPVARFWRAALDALPVARFWRAALDALPRDADLFPRVELVGAGELRLRIRPAPARGTSVRVLAPGRPDPRRWPRRKGPDLARLERLRERARALGADDLLLTTAGGLLLESTTASLVWWEGETLCVPDEALPVLPGVTSRLIRAAAARAGVVVRPRRARLEDLHGHETWLVNALHGIRPGT